MTAFRMSVQSTNVSPPTEWGYLFGKHPQRAQVFETGYGEARVWYTAHAPLTIAVWERIAPYGTPRDSHAHIVTRHPITANLYCTSSLWASTLHTLFSTAMSGRCTQRPALVDREARVCVEIAPVLVRAKSHSILRQAFQPLGYDVRAQYAPLDAELGWDTSDFARLTLTHEAVTVPDVLRHLYIIIPALSNIYHYAPNQDTVQVLRDYAPWLLEHPLRKFIVKRALQYHPNLIGSLYAGWGLEQDAHQARTRKHRGLHYARHLCIARTLKDARAESVLEIGCGGGKFLSVLKKEGFAQTALAGVDIEPRYLRRAQKWLPEATFKVGSALYADELWANYDAVVASEVIEHLGVSRTDIFAEQVLGVTRPRLWVLTTPNREYNAEYGLSGLRHRDHQFEWTRAECRAWGERVAAEYGYTVEWSGIGEPHPAYGASSQMLVFRRVV